MSAFINPKILKLARKKAGYSIEEAAKSYINPEKLRKAEKGEADLTFKQFLAIANVYKRSPAFFYLKKPPKEEVIEKKRDFRTIESRDVRFSPLLRDKIKRIREKREFAVNFKSYDREHDYSFLSSITIKENPEFVGKKIRELLGINLRDRKNWKTKYDAFNAWKEKIEDLGILIFQISKIDVDEMRGYSISKKPYPTIVLNRSDSVLGRIFTLIHELCHLMLQKGGICTFTQEDEKHFKIEKCCNAVAGAVLVPKDMLFKVEKIRHYDSSKEWSEKELNDLKRVFWASKEVILRRLLIFEKTNKKFYQKKRTEWLGYSKPSRSGGPPPHIKVISGNSKSYIRNALNAMDNGDITMQDASYYLGMSLKHLPKLRKGISD